MIVEHKTIYLFGKLLFELALIKPPFKKPNPMPNEACFVHIRQGAYNSISEDEILKSYQGQSVLMKCGSYLSQMVPDSETGMYEAVAVHFHPEVLRKIYEKETPSFLYKKKVYTGNNMTVIHASAPIEKYIEDILFYFDHPQLANEDILVLKVKEIILLLMQTRDASNVRHILENLFSKRVIGFKKSIESHIFSDVTVGELAQLNYMSLSSFKRMFKETYDTSPSQYISAKRLEKSKELLTISDLSISAIAYDCGFKTISHFSKKFKQEYGMSPTVFKLNLSDK